MTTSIHVYSALLLGAGSIPLSVRTGTVTLDADGFPHVTATIEIAPPGSWNTVNGVPRFFPNTNALASLDPRQNKRIRVQASASFSSGTTQSRSFDLGLRERTVNHREGTITLLLASDEALLTDYATLADDTFPFSLSTSLRAVINYVLTAAGTGAALAVSPAIDADITPYWSITNLATNPQCDTATGYAAAGGTSAVATSGSTPWQGSASVVWNASAAGVAFLQVPNEPSCRAGETFTASAYVRANTGTTTRTGRILVRFTNDAGSLLGDFTSTPINISYSAWTRLALTVTAPVGATRVFMFMRQDAVAASDQFAVDGVMLYRDSRVIPFFHGGSVGGGYTYAWGAAGANASASTRTPIAERSPDAFTLRAGQSAMNFLAPIVMAAGFRLVCDESRTWTLRSASYVAPGGLEIRHGVNIVDATDGISRAEESWFDAAVIRWIWTDSAGVRQERIEGWALTPTYTRQVTFERTSAYPGPGMAEYLVRRAQGRGRELTLTTVADWSARAEQPIVASVDGAPTQTGKTGRIVYNLDRDEMTVLTRTTDTPAGAIDLKPGTINALAGTINAQ